MIQRYLGNKNTLASFITQEVNRFCLPGDYVCDIFSGTISVSMALKGMGFRVISNDINLFSYHFANAFLRNNTIPDIDLVRLGIPYDDFRIEAERRIQEKDDEEGYLFLQSEYQYRKYLKLVILLLYLESIDDADIPAPYLNHYFVDTYTVDGQNSAFKSLRGTTGNRRFFTRQNGNRLDLVLGKIREWVHTNALSDVLYSLLISVVCESAEKISNTQGTFHDFQRDTYDERALKPLTLRLPAFDGTLVTKRTHIIGRAQDSLDFIKTVPKHKLLYIDPPYNFRQYTSYYFMLNLICEYCYIPDLTNYFDHVQFVRGQNMQNDFDSSFCKSELFLPSLTQLIRDAKTQYVIMSYYDARNHENKGKKKGDLGISGIVNLFKSDIFVPNSFEMKSFERTNYQSYSEHNAEKCQELLFIAQKNVNR